MDQLVGIGGPSHNEHQALVDQIAQTIVSIANASTGLVSNVNGEISISGGMAYIYLYGNGIKTLGNDSSVCLLKEKYRPKLSGGNYIILPLFSESSPYTPVGTIWLYTTGEVKKYGTANSGLYVGGAYPISY